MSNETKALEIQQDDAQAVEKTERLRDRRVVIPKTDIYETQDRIVLVMDVPGADDHSVDVTLEKNVLTVSAFPAYTRPGSLTLAYAEYGECDYQRSFNLSDEVDRGKIEARVKQGVLYLHLAKAGETRPHKISVRAG